MTQPDTPDELRRFHVDLLRAFAWSHDSQPPAIQGEAEFLDLLRTAADLIDRGSAHDLLDKVIALVLAALDGRPLPIDPPPPPVVFKELTETTRAQKIRHEALRAAVDMTTCAALTGDLEPMPIDDAITRTLTAAAAFERYIETGVHP